MSAIMILLRGLPGSGKSTWAKQYLDMNKDRKTAYINKDDIRFALFGDYEPVHNENHVHLAMLKQIEAAIDGGIDIIVDNTHLTEKSVKELIKIAEAANYTPQIFDFRDVPLETCLERNAKRDRKVPESVIRDMHKRFIEGKV